MFFLPHHLAQIEHWIQLAEQSTYSAMVMSRSLGISKRQLRRYARTCLNRSLQNWLDEQRLIRAGQMLKKVQMVKVVAFQLGFKQVSHFSRKFKLRYGVCPTAYLASNATRLIPPSPANPCPRQITNVRSRKLTLA